MINKSELTARLNAPLLDDRLAALAELRAAVERGELTRPATGTDVNNHIHTWYSFSPYSPSSAVWHAYEAGLATAGIMDHDSVAGLAEFRRAGEIVGIETTGGAEVRVSFAGTGLENVRINNPDQSGVVYMAMHGIPLSACAKVDAFLLPYRAARGVRNRKMTDNINAITGKSGVTIDYDADVLPLSKAAEGGSVTERHILFALAKKLIAKFGIGAELVSFLRGDLGVAVSAKNEGLLTDASNSVADYDLLGLLKAGLVEKFYINATDECPPASAVVKLCRETGAVSAYAYLGDVGESVTGDKKAQKFEDSYLDELFVIIHKLGYDAVTYMPSRNTPEQLKRVRALCDKYKLRQISGEDINSPRQKFVCVAARGAEFDNLKESTYWLIRHERDAE